MENNAHFSQKKHIFHGKQTPEQGTIVGYAAIIDKLKLKMPMVTPIALVCDKNKNYQNEELDSFTHKLFTRRQPRTRRNRSII